MKWSHGEEIKLTAKTIDGQQGIFLLRKNVKKYLKN